jgi:hypothetical protein
MYAQSMLKPVTASASAYDTLITVTPRGTRPTWSSPPT